MGRKPKPEDEKNLTVVVSFRVHGDVYKRLERYADGQRDEAGSPLNVSGAARRAMMLGLEKLAPSKPPKK